MNILFVSLGCDKNLVDTEVMLGLLASRGHQMVDSEEIADVIAALSTMQKRRVSRRFLRWQNIRKPVHARR